MTTLSAWKLNTLQGADEASANLEKKKPKTVILPV